MEPPPESSARGALRAVVRWVAPHRAAFVGAVVLGGVASVFEVVSIGLLGPLLLVSGGGLEATNPGPFSRLIPMLRGLTPDAQRGVIVSMIVAGIALRGIAWWAAAALREKIAASVQVRARRRVFERAARAPIGFLERRALGDLQALVMHETERLGLAAGHLVTLCTMTAMALGYAAYLLYLAPALTLAAFGFLGMVAATIRSFRRPIERQAERMRRENRAMASTLHETLAAIHLLKQVGRGSEAVDRFDATNRRYLAGQRRQRRLLDAIPPVSELCGAAAILAVLWLGSTVLPIRGEADRVLLLPYVLLFYRLLPRFLAIPASRAALSANLPSIPPIGAFLAEPAAAPVPDGGRPPPSGSRRVALEGVRFRHRDDGPFVLDGLDLVLEPGRTTALVGRSGAGKSTAVDLLLGLRRPDAGRVTVDGEDLATFDGEAWRRRVGIVPQEPRLFDWSVRDNLRLTAPDADDERLWRALDDAAVGDVVRGLPGGLDARLGDRGARLSGGERQRVCLARALLEDPALLVFDEPTSHLDPDGERAVAAAIARVARGRTTLLIAHRLSTVRTADRIVLLDAGRVREAGSHDELLARAGEYARLVRLGLDDLEASGNRPRG